MHNSPCWIREYGWVKALSFLLLSAAGTQAQNGTWTNTGSGLWSNARNWSGSVVADGASNTADFGATDIAADVTVHLDTVRRVGSVLFGDTATHTPAGWTVDNNGDETNVLTLAGSACTIIVTTNLGTDMNATISAPLELAAVNTEARVGADRSLTLSGNITTSVGIGTTLALAKKGTGALDITGRVFAPTDLCLRQINLAEGVAKISAATVYGTSLSVGSYAYVHVLNSTVALDSGGQWWGALLMGQGSTVSSYSMEGGTLSPGNGIAIETYMSGGQAIMLFDGGAVVNTVGIDIGDSNCNYGAMVVRNAAINSGAIWVGVAQGFSVFNQFGGTVNSGRSEIQLHYRMGSRTSCWGIYNLNGGRLTTAKIISADGDAKFTQNNAYFNFHGGILSPSAPDLDFVYSRYPTSPRDHAPQLFVYFEGTIIDTAGHDIVIREPLMAPPGKGVTNGTIMLTPTDQGAGYLGTPVVTIARAADDTTGAAATAVANMADDGSGNGTFKIESITISNPGVRYTAVPVLSIAGGNPTAPAVIPTLGIATNASGGLTKLGDGALTLTGMNSYTGATIVSRGKLSLGTASLHDESDVYVVSGVTLALDYNGIDMIGGLYLNGTAQPQGYYRAGALDGIITGTGRLKVTKGPPAPGLRVTIK